MKNSNFKSITLITSPGKGLRLVEELYKRNIGMVDFHNARGSHIGASTRRNGSPIETEQEIVTCIVEESKADAIFAEIYELAGVNKPGGGFMYLRDLSKCSDFVLPRAS